MQWFHLKRICMISIPDRIRPDNKIKGDFRDTWSDTLTVDKLKLIRQRESLKGAFDLWNV